MSSQDIVNEERRESPLPNFHVHSVEYHYDVVVAMADDQFTTCGFWQRVSVILTDSLVHRATSPASPCHPDRSALEFILSSQWGVTTNKNIFGSTSRLLERLTLYYAQSRVPRHLLPPSASTTRIVLGTVVFQPVILTDMLQVIGCWFFLTGRYRKWWVVGRLVLGGGRMLNCPPRSLFWQSSAGRVL